MRNLRGWLIACLLLAVSSANANPFYADTNITTITPAYLAHENDSIAEKNYQKLRDALPIYQNAIMHPWPIIQTRHLLKPGMKGAKILLLRERLSATNELLADDTDSDIFDGELMEAVKGFQQRNGLKADGIVGQATLDELNVPAEVRIKQIQINMQRWANLSPNLGNRFIIVNVPDYRLTVYEDNQEILSMKAIVGKPEWPTPELQSKVIRMVFNPPWNVPESIANKEMVNKIIENPNYLEENRIQIFHSQESDAEPINPNEIDWYSMRENGFPYFFRQDPGDDNSLGLVKFEFDNSQNIYLHDTPAKELFNQDTRDLSHGCIRLENAFALVDYLMRDNPDWSEDHLQEILLTGKTKYVKAFRVTPILITYITAWVDDDGAVNFRPDIYGKDV